MDNKTKKIMLMASIIFTIIFIVYMLCEFKSATNLEVRSGTYYSKLNILDEGNTRVFNWEVGISKNNVKRGVVKNEFNIETFEKFRDAIISIKSVRSNLFLFILYLIFMVIASISIQKNAQLFKEKNSKKIFHVFITLLITYLLFRISVYFIELNRLHRDIVYYFTLIN